ncbi:MAG TPA: hypothetical protein VIH35_09270 [Kiritimatiellia bacterium]|jgi:hypothetical protein
MRKFALAFTFALACMVLVCPRAFAGAQDFTIENATGADIHQLYVSPTDADDWQEDVLGEEGILEEGDSATVRFDPGEDSTYWDIKVADSDGTEIVWQKLNLKKIGKVTLYFDEDGNPVADVE